MKSLGELQRSTAHVEESLDKTVIKGNFHHFQFAETCTFYLPIDPTQMMSSEHLACGWLQKLLVVLVKLCFTFAGPLRPLNGTGCTARGPASYILVFTGHWSPQAFPKQYPLFRPPAQWSKLVAVSHNHHFRLWEEGSSASPGLQSFAEVGVTVELMKAAKEARKKRTVGAMHRTAGIPNGIGHSSTEMLMVPRNPLWVVAKLVPISSSLWAGGG
ncbi:hypothetical protein CHARACLAT_011917, partial [Characodon lateralis]|nr:hypothetical protein [Characodon lateralis]